MNRSVLRGIFLIAIAIVIVVGLILMPGAKPKPKPTHPPNNDPWLLVSYDPNNPYGTYLGNGFISTRIMANGVGTECYMAGLYNKEKLIPTPTWSDLRFFDGKIESITESKPSEIYKLTLRFGAEFKLDKTADYKQTLDMKTGTFTTEATWRASDKTLTGSIAIVASRATPGAGLVWAKLTPDFTGNVSAKSCFSIDGFKSGPLLCYGSEDRERFPRNDLYTDMMAFRSNPSGNEDMELSLFHTIDPSVMGFIGSVSLEVKTGRQFDIRSWSYWRRGVNPGCPREFERAVNSPDKFIAAHKAAMAKLWQKDIIIDGPAQDQQAIHSCMFYLMQSVREGSQWSIPPMGLSNNAFSGHVFWDADLWMFPALILQHPELAKSIVDYRYKTLSGAMANAKADGFAGAQYAWESGYTGKEDTPKGLVYRHERHINGDVAIAQWQYYLATGDLNWLKTRGYPVLKATADWWVSKAKFIKEKKRYEILQVVPPDENAELVNNSAYTNAIAQMNLKIASQAAKLTGNAANPKWSEVASMLYIPYDASKKRFIAYDGYKGDKAKQADTELIAYPLQFSIPGADMNVIYKSNYDYYAPKVDKNGPAMTSSAHAVIAARLGDCDQAYADFTRSYKDYLRGPFNYFNEKRSRTWEQMCFLTGAAGPIQATLFGLAGARMDYFPKDPATAGLQFKPCLPKAWKSLKITGVQWRGKTFDVIIDKTNKATILPK
ncbi:MAG: hypothetical protein NT018_13935 [Armatimonadetes bacterium]|nr:hypothetical protein [Armatimonadota bacterium]